MEDTFDIYETPYNSEISVICMDEKNNNTQARFRSHSPYDWKITRKLTLNMSVREHVVFLQNSYVVHVITVFGKTRTVFGWSEEIKYLLPECYPNYPKIILIMDNLSTFVLATLYKKYLVYEARIYAKGWKHIISPNGRIIATIHLHFETLIPILLRS